MNVSPVQRKLEAEDVAPERLAGNSQLTEEQKVGEAARQFEAVLLRQILESTQKTVIRSSFSDDSTTASVYRDMVTNQLADSISKSGGMGLARTLKQEFMRQLESTSPAGRDPLPGAPPTGLLDRHVVRPVSGSAPHRAGLANLNSTARGATSSNP